MGVERFPAAKARLKKVMKDKTAGFNVQLTPVGQSTHIRSGFMDPDCLAISIPNSSQAFILVNREELEQRVLVDGSKSSIIIDESRVIRAIEMIDAEITGKNKLINTWKNKLAKGFGAIRHRLSSVRRSAPKSKHVRELEAENRRLKDAANKEAGTIVEMQIAGLIPMKGKPPFPLRNIHQMHYGCDWLSMVWKGDELHLFFIESNLTRTATNPPLTENEGRLRTALVNKRVFPHHCHHWVDKDGEMHWDRE